MELFDLYDCQRRPLGRTMIRGEKVPVGCYRLVVHICIFNSRGELLIQQRQSFKDGWPGMWDVSVGGSVTAGENSQQGAHRELLEELGLDVDFSGLAPVLTTTFTGGFDDIFVLNMEPELDDLKLQESEVQAVKWASQAEILDMIAAHRFIPYSAPFMEYLFFRRNHGGNFDTDR